MEILHLPAIRVAALAMCSTIASLAYGREDMSGAWKEEYTETIYGVEQWGLPCGEAPRSTGKRSRNLTFSVEDRGVDLLFKAPSGEIFSTAACQSDNPDLKAKERSLKEKLFLINCTTEETAQFYESGLYSFRLESPNRIEYRETTRFSRNIQGSLCVHTRRVRRVYLREKTSEPSASPRPDAQMPPVVGRKIGTALEDPCEKPGSPVRLVMTPTQATVAREEKFCPKTQAFDERGCLVQTSISWGRGVPPPGIKLTTDGCLLPTNNAKSGSNLVILAAGNATAQINLVVRKPASAPLFQEKEPELVAPYGRLEKPPEEGAKVPKPPPAEAASLVTATEAKAATSWVWPTAIGSGVLAMAVAAGVILVLRRRRGFPVASVASSSAVPRLGAPPTVPEPQWSDASPAIPIPETSKDQPDRIFCTSCGRAIPSDANFCPFDRSPVYRPGTPTLHSAPICPVCQRLLPLGAKFCPYDQTKLT